MGGVQVSRIIARLRMVALWTACIALFPAVCIYAVWFFTREFGFEFWRKA